MFRASTYALSEIGPAAVPVLIAALNEPGHIYSGRSSIASALGDIGPAAKEAVPVLTKALKDEDGQVRYAAQEALDKIKAEK